MTLDKGKGKAKSDADSGSESKKGNKKGSDDSGGEVIGRDTKSQRPRCSKCGSTQIHTRIRDGAIVCHTCGYVELKERKKEV